MAVLADNHRVDEEGQQNGQTASLADVVEWDIRNWSAALDYWLLKSSHQLSDCIALEIGSRRGGLSLWMAQHGATVVCSDLHGVAEEAIQKHRAFGVAESVEYQSIDARCIPYKDHFDIVFFKSVLGGIEGNDKRECQATAISQMHQALKKGGELFFAENLVASPFHSLSRRSFVQWGTRWRYVSLEEMREFLSPFSKVTYRTIGFLAAFGRNEKQRDALGRLDRSFVDSVVPSSWRYIVIGVATK
jgi:SAM-dependent methyltransferase